MAAYSSVRSRRFAAIRKESTKQIITFRLLDESFALPIKSVQKVIPLGKVYGDPRQTGISLTNYENQEIVVLDIDRLFQKDNPSATNFSPDRQRFLLIVENTAKESVGLPIDFTPALRRVPVSSFVALPPAYASQGNIRCLTSTIIQIEGQPSLFLLDPEKLFQ